MLTHYHTASKPFVSKSMLKGRKMDLATQDNQHPQSQQVITISIYSIAQRN